MRYELADYEWTAIKPMLPNKQRGVDVIVSGHSHVLKINTENGLLYVSPGSARRRRFNLPITLASLEITLHGLKPIIHDLEVG